MKVLTKVLSGFSFLATLSFAYLYSKRKQLPFNQEGRYYDENAMVVIHEQSVELFGLLTLIGLFFTCLLFFLWHKDERPKY